MLKKVTLLVLLVGAVALLQAASQSAQKGQAAAAAAKPAAEDHKVWAPADVKWGAAPDILPAGAQLAVLEGDPTKPGEFTMRLKMPNGYKIPPHFHPRMEHVTLISGGFYVGMGDKFDESKMGGVPVGTFIWIKPGTHHFAMAKGETVIQLHGNGPWSLTYINPTDDPRKKK